MSPREKVNAKKIEVFLPEDKIKEINHWLHNGANSDIVEILE